MSGETKKTRGRPKKINREEVIQAAMLCYWEEGPAGLSVNEICRRLGVSKPALYREFGGVEQLMVEALDCYRGRVLEPLMSLFVPERPAAVAFGLLAGWLGKEQVGPAGCLFSKMRSSPSLIPESVVTRTQEIQEELRTVYAAWYTAATARGEVKPDLTPELAAHYIDSQVMNAMVKLGLGDDREVVAMHTQLALGGLLVA